MDTTQDRVDRAVALQAIEAATKLWEKAEADVQKAQTRADAAMEDLKAAVAQAKKIGALR